jgi:serine phosphatase RsbU (regulator of sigma subunit)
MFKGDNKHIGDPPYIGFESYKTSFTTLNDEDQLYLFTDGFQDQFGGENDKKFSFRKLLVSFEENAKLPLHQQKSTLENDFDEWIGQNDQTDDVTILSIIRNPTL